MKLFIVKKWHLILCLCLFCASFSPLAVSQAMASRRDIPIVSVETQENEISFTVNVYEYTDIENLLKNCENLKITFFISENFECMYPEKIKDITSKGHSVGILLGETKNETVQAINDKLADRIESLSKITQKNIELVRFDENLYDSNAVKAVYYLDLFPVQWATDDNAEQFSKGDIVLLSDVYNMKKVVKKTAADGFNPKSVDELILKSDYKVDLRGMQMKK